MGSLKPLCPKVLHKGSRCTHHIFGFSAYMVPYLHFLPRPVVISTSNLWAPSGQQLYFYICATRSKTLCDLGKVLSKRKWRANELQKASNHIAYCCLATKSCLTLCNLWDCSLQAPLSMRFSRQEYQSGLSFPPPGNLPDPGTELGLLSTSPARVSWFGRQILYHWASWEAYTKHWNTQNTS